jgi:predicted AlkP superfamily phosphohydrolase/phosphomutase
MPHLPRRIPTIDGKVASRMKVLLIGWDAAGWEQLHPLLERGQMPHLQRLLSRGSGGELHPVRPFESASLWTTIATGKRPTKHRVLADLELSPDGSEWTPVQAAARKTVAVWDILSHAGVRTHVVNWPATHPAEAVQGVMVSDGFVAGNERDGVSPPSQAIDLLRLWLGPDEVDDASLRALDPALPPEKAPHLRQFIATAARTHAAATWLLEREPWDFAALRYSALPLLALCPNATRAAGLRFHDMMLGRLLELAGPETAVLLASERGTPQPDGTRGIAAVAGPGFVDGRLLIGATVCDVTPTILHLFGLPIGEDMDGQPWTQAMSSSQTVATRPTWETIASANRRPVPKGRPATATPPERQSVIDAFETDQKRRLAKAWADAGHHEAAAQVLEELVRHEPGSIPYRSALAEAYFRANRRAECRQVIDALSADGIDTPLLHVARAALDLADGRHEAARTQLQHAIAMGPASPEVWEAIGRVMFRLRDFAGARDAFSRSIFLNPENAAAAHTGLAAVALVDGDPVEAERHAREALSSAPRSLEAHCRLARALARQRRNREAAEVLDAAVLINPAVAERERRLLTRYRAPS